MRQESQDRDDRRLDNKTYPVRSPVVRGLLGGARVGTLVAGGSGMDSAGEGDGASDARRGEEPPAPEHLVSELTARFLALWRVAAALDVGPGSDPPPEARHEVARAGGRVRELLDALLAAAEPEGEPPAAPPPIEPAPGLTG